MDYAHYMTLFPGERFCVLLDNAHNLPLHLAVELGVPVAALLCFAVLAWVWKARPWSETDPARQLAWGILALVGLHSMLEFPLWYGPFQIVTLWALALLWRGRGLDAAVQVVRRVPLGLWAVVAVAGLVLWGRWGGSTTASARSTRLWRSACLPCATTPWRRCKAVGCSKMPLPLPS